MLATIDALDKEQELEVVHAAQGGLYGTDQRQAARAFLPTVVMTDRIWMVVVSASAVVLVGPFFTLAISVFVPRVRGTSGRFILTVFTTISGFLAGCLPPARLRRAWAPWPGRTSGAGPYSPDRHASAARRRAYLGEAGWRT